MVALPPEPHEPWRYSDPLLNERGKTHGNAKEQFALAQLLKVTISREPNFATMEPYQREALEMIVVKISRILHGDPDHRDAWDDIAGYAKIVSETLAHDAVPNIKREHIDG